MGLNARTHDTPSRPYSMNTHLFRLSLAAHLRPKDGLYDGVCKAICLRFAPVGNCSLNVFTRFHNTPTPLTRPFAHTPGRVWPVKTNQITSILQFCVALFFFGLRLMRGFSLLLKMSDFRINSLMAHSQRSHLRS